MADNETVARTHIFEKAYATGIWSGTGESLSGDGSSLAETEEIRRALPVLLRDLGVRKLLDVPCGDWNWMSHVELPVEKYVGGDLVRAVVEENTARFGNARTEFCIIDLCVDALPAADLLLCRHALIHFSYADIWRALANVVRAEITFFATTTHPGMEKNTDLSSGAEWRHLDLEIAPFEFPPPLLSIPDGPVGVHLAVWRVRDIRDKLGARSELTTPAPSPH